MSLRARPRGGTHPDLRAGGLLEADPAGGVLCLRLSESVARARRELLDQARLAEAAQLHVAFGGVNGLCVPVGVQGVDGVFGLRLGEAVARAGRKLLEQSLIAEPLPLAEVAFGGIDGLSVPVRVQGVDEIGRASCRERVLVAV